MRADSQDLVWLDARCVLGLSEVARMCQLPESEVQELVEYGLLAPLDPAAPRPLFGAACVEPLRRASALRRRFDLDLFALGLVFSQLEQIARLEQQVRSLQARVPRAEVARDGPAPWHEPHG